VKIAIIGSGISGLVSAFLLNRSHEISLFEASDRVGGHTHTVEVTVDGRRHAVDTGFMLFNNSTYPNFTRLLGQLGVGFKPTPMGFSVTDPDTGLQYNGNNLNGLFAQRRNLLSPGFWGMLRDISRFNKEAQRDLSEGRIAADATLDDYLKAGGYSERFILHYIVPMGAAIWSMPMADMLGFPMQVLVRYFKNHGLLSMGNRPQWSVIEGGSSAYIAPLTASFKDKIRLDCPVNRVERDKDAVVIHSASGSERFDKVVFACHSDQALKLLSEPSDAEQSILGALPYADNEVVLHTDTSLLPERKAARAGCNYRLGGPGHTRVAVTYDMNIVQGIQSDSTFCVSLNQSAGISPFKVLAQYAYAHPQFSLTAVAAQVRWEELNGAHHTYYCGAYWASGSHEDGVISALRVARSFGEAL
jgi:predicted NAD/FAD-binding protein